MKAKSFRVSTIGDVDATLGNTKSDGFEPTIAFVFLSALLDEKDLCAVFDKHNIRVFGSHTTGEFIDGNVGQQSIAVLLLDLDPAAYFLTETALTAGSETETTRALAQKAQEKFENPVFLVVTSHLETSAEDIIAGVVSVIGPDAEVYGAMAGMNVETQENKVFSDGNVHDRGIVLMAIDGDKISVNGIATCGWRAVGSEKTITKSQGMWVHEIDDQPALTLMLKYAGIGDKSSLTPEMWVNEFATALPMQLIREEGASVMRPSLAYDADTDSVMCNGRIPVGSKVRFSLPPEDDVIDSVIDACQGMKENRAPDADAIVYFSCAGRFFSLGPLMKREIETVKAMWDVPLAGFFSTGEMARATGGKLELNNITSCCVVLKEK
jgi:hypothetical protein